jgi:hypothetical protein
LSESKNVSRRGSAELLIPDSPGIDKGRVAAEGRLGEAEGEPQVSRLRSVENGGDKEVDQ